MDSDSSSPHVSATCPYPKPDQSIQCPHPTSWRSTAILSSHASLRLPGGLFPSGFPIEAWLFHTVKKQVIINKLQPVPT
jgi:hypothetical protein